MHAVQGSRRCDNVMSFDEKKNGDDFTANGAKKIREATS